MRAISELFSSTILVVPCAAAPSTGGVTPISGNNISVAPLSAPSGSGLRRKVGLLFWLARNSPTILREIRCADAVHAPIPGDIGTIGMLLAIMLRKPLLVRYCGNWFVQQTAAEHFWRWFMERAAGGRNVMLATGGAPQPPSTSNPEVHWIFSTSLRQKEIAANALVRELKSGGARLIIACRQEHKKGTDVIIESLSHLSNEFPEITLDVVGDGGALARFKELAATHGVSDRVTFHGKVSHAKVLGLLRQADLFCFPTTSSEGFPKAVLEALACGLPVVTTRVSVLPELVSAGVGCGVLINEATPEATAAGVQATLADAQRYRQMSAQAVETARQYSLESWRDTIGAWLYEAWGPLRSDA